MNAKSQIAAYYFNARELIKQNNPKAARGYVLLILNSAVKNYNGAKTILGKAKTAAFLDKWIAVSRDLYDKGITDYVKECFGLAVAQSVMSPKQTVNPQIKSAPVEPTVPDGEIDISGLIAEAPKFTSWGSALFEEKKSATVKIYASLTGGVASGTGFIISNNGYLLTNDHVVFDEDNGVYYSKIKMSLADDKKEYKIEVLFSDKNTDVALCKFDPDEVSGFTCVKRISDYSKVQQGDDCLVIGNAFDFGLSPLIGHVKFTKDSEGNLVHDAPSNHGDSGGPVFNRNGVCIGINKSKTIAVNGETAFGLANATPMDKIEELLEKWTKNNDILL